MLKIKNGREIYLTRGDDAYIDLKIQQPNFPFEEYKLSGKDECILSVKKKVNDEEYVFQKKLENNSFHIEPKDTKNLEFGSYCYDVQLTLEVGDVLTVVETSLFYVCSEVTN